MFDAVEVVSSQRRIPVCGALGEDQRMQKMPVATAERTPENDETSAEALQAYTVWEGRTEEAHDVVSVGTAAMLHATLDREGLPPENGAVLPAGWHWACFAPCATQSSLDSDGHPQRGEFLPPVPLPRRMWAGGRLRWHTPLTVGDAVWRMSRILAVRPKVGHSGPLVFVTVLHEIHGPHGLAITEEQDIVYRKAASSGARATDSAALAGKRSAVTAAWRREVNPSPALLFRYSALTFNAHRIHYDRPFACDVEGYPGLVVHGPLQATLLLDIAARERPDQPLQSFSFSARAPLFDGQVFAACGAPAGAASAVLWTEDFRGQIAMQAEILWR